MSDEPSKCAACFDKKDHKDEEPEACSMCGIQYKGDCSTDNLEFPLDDDGDEQDPICHKCADTKFTCIGCDKICDVDDLQDDYPKHWSEPLTMGKCLECEKAFACSECMCGWSYQARHYCESHFDKYDDKDPRWNILCECKEDCDCKPA